MNDDVVIRAEGLGKKYSIRHQRGERYTALRDVLADKAKSLFRRKSGNGSRADGSNSLTSDIGPLTSARATHEDFWALKNVSFEVKRGEVIGIIGRNGAGKSTLLKILSRITEPTEGKVRIKGRVAALLEVGTGFHPELTGRENIFLNGAVLGMTRAEIKRKFDEIVAFAETERFLDTPVKRYSSGMYVRLAFAVAAHLEPEILVVDEVLAVGDAAFQKKCLGKMGEVAKGGRTVLFVSHNMGALRRLCNRALLLDKGIIISSGRTEDVSGQYVDSVLSKYQASECTIDEQFDLPIQILRLAVTDERAQLVSSLELDSQIFLELDFVVRRDIAGSNLAIWITKEGATVLVSFDIDLSEVNFEKRLSGYYTASVPLPRRLLALGRYTVSADAGLTARGSISGCVEQVSFEIIANREDLTHKSYSRPATVIAELRWDIRKVRDT